MGQIKRDYQLDDGQKRYFASRVQDAEKDLSYVEEYIDIRDKRVLEVGCGSGGKTAYFSVQAALAIGIDISESVLLANELVKIADMGSQSNTLFCMADATTLPFPDDYFDVVILHDVMEHVISPKRTLASIRRVLRRGGQLSIIMPHFYGLSGSHLWNYFRSTFWRHLHIHTLLPAGILRPLIYRIGRNKGYPKTQIDWEWNQFVELNRLRTGRLIQLLDSYFNLRTLHFRRGKILEIIPESLQNMVLVESFSWGIVAVAQK